MLSRRQFVLRTSSLVSLSPLVPGVLARTAQAAAAEPDARALVVVQLDGGNDGLNTVVPYADDQYARLRPRLRVETKSVHKLNDAVGLHPSMRAAKELVDDGRLAVVQNVGYPNPNRSHFTSMRIWQTARFDETAHDEYGWLGRAMDRQLPSLAAGETPLVYVGQEQTPVALWGRRAAVTSMSRLEDLVLHEKFSRLRTDGPRETSTVELFVAGQVLSAYASAEELAGSRLGKAVDGDAPYPNSGLASRLKIISQLLQSGSRARVFYTAQTGYDTHAAQQFTHANLLSEFSQALKAFLDDLRAAGLDQRIVVLAFSEFGRRARENDSLGTDHGAAGPVFVAGPQVRSGAIGAAPNLSDLDAGDVRMQVDFRQLYAELLDRWLNVQSQEVLQQNFDPVSILKA